MKFPILIDCEINFFFHNKPTNKQTMEFLLHLLKSYQTDVEHNKNAKLKLHKKIQKHQHHHKHCHHRRRLSRWLKWFKYHKFNNQANLPIYKRISVAEYSHE